MVTIVAAAIPLLTNYAGVAHFVGLLKLVEHFYQTPRPFSCRSDKYYEHVKKYHTPTTTTTATATSTSTAASKMTFGVGMVVAESENVSTCELKILFFLTDLTN